MAMYQEDNAQGDFAGRIGKIAETYREVAKARREQSPQEEIYEDTLHICLLHTLLTSCNGLLEKWKRNAPNEVTTLLNEQSKWGLTTSMVQTTFANEVYDGELRVPISNVIRHMRNAVSHPAEWAILSGNIDHPDTGFYCSESKDGKVAAFTFIHSPDVRGGEIVTYESRDAAKRALYNNYPPFHVKLEYPEDAVIYPVNNRYGIYHNDNHFARKFEIKIPVENLQDFVQELSCFLFRKYGGDAADRLRRQPGQYHNTRSRSGRTW